MQDPVLPKNGFRALTFAASLIAFAVTPALHAQSSDAAEDDPWFSKEREVGLPEGEVEKSEALIQKGPNAWTTYQRVLKALKETNEHDLITRISLVEQAMAAYPKFADKHEPLHKELTALLAKIRQDLDQAGRSNQSVEQALDTIAPYRDYFIADTTLLVELLHTKLMASVDEQLRSISRHEDFARIDAIEAKLDAHRLNPILGQRFRSIMTDSLAGRIERRWSKASSGLGSPAGADYLVGRLIEAEDLKLTLKLQTPSNADRTLQSGIKKGLEQGWSRDFRIVTADSTTAKADLILNLVASDIETRVEEQSSILESSIPGKIVEEPNPDFMKLTKKYEKEAKRYEAAMEAYETNYGEYMRQFEDNSGQHLTDMLGGPVTESSAAPTTVSAPSGPGAEGFVDPRSEPLHESVARNIAEVQANAISMINIPEPRMPEPLHLAILEELYLTPSTIVISSESTAYEYTTKSLEYTFRSSAELAVATPTGTPIQAKESVNLTQQRNWTQNLGVSPKDPAVSEGDFSDQALNSAKSIFSLEFGARCAKSLDSLLNAAVDTLSRSSSDSDATWLALALDVQRNKRSSFQLSARELRELATLAGNDQLSDQDFQTACLRIVAQKGGIALTL